MGAKKEEVERNFTYQSKALKQIQVKWEEGKKLFSNSVIKVQDKK